MKRLSIIIFSLCTLSLEEVPVLIEEEVESEIADYIIESIFDSPELEKILARCEEIERDPSFS